MDKTAHGSRQTFSITNANPRTGETFSSPGGFPRGKVEGNAGETGDRIRFTEINLMSTASDEHIGLSMDGDGCNPWKCCGYLDGDNLRGNAGAFVH